ncbi:hypothetical protein ACQ4WX_46605 [Streptomyces lasalocidi]
MRALEQAKDAHRDRWSEALMIAPDAVTAPAHELDETLPRVYGQVKRLEQGNPRPDETLRSAAAAQHTLWSLIGTLREAMRRDLGVGGDTEARQVAGHLRLSPSSAETTAFTRDLTEPRADSSPRSST